MKTYKNLISEMSEFRKQFRENEIRYPGVHMFMSIASRYLNRPEKLKDSELVRLLKRLRIRGDINGFTKGDFSRVYKFITNKNLTDVESTRTYFQNAKEGISNDLVEEPIEDIEDIE